MFKSQKYTLHGKISNWNLMWAMRVIAYIKQPPYIPFYEQMTFQQISEYFKVPETRVRNAYKSNQGYFQDDMCVLSGKELAESAVKVQSLGRHYGNILTFANGVMIQAAHSANTLFNARALLHFAVLLCEESELAKEIADKLWAGCQDTSVLSYCRVPHLKPWFKITPEDETHEEPIEKQNLLSDLVKQINENLSDKVNLIVVAN